MTFLSPLALFGILLLALPILVHLFKPRKMKQTPFSSLRWLKLTHQRLSRRIQWHQWLLFLMRAGFLVLLVLALARPLVGFGSSSKPIDRVVIVDFSRSMAYQAAEMQAPLDKAKELASSLLARTRPGDRTALVTAGTPPHVVTGLSADASAFAETIKALPPGQADASISSVLPLVKPLPGKSERSLELVILTDNLKRRWKQSDIQAFMKDQPGPVRVELVDLGPGSPQNAWITEAKLLTFGPERDRILRVGVGFVGDGKASRDVRLAGIEGFDTDMQTVSLHQGRTSRVDFRIPAKVNLTGQVAEVRLEPGDALPSDDVYYLNLDAFWAPRVLVVEPEANSADGRAVGLNLQLAAESLLASNKQMVQVEAKPAASVGADQMLKADVIFLAGVPELTNAALTALESRVKAGAGLVIFLGPQVRPAFYNQMLHKPLQPAESLMPLPLASGPEVVVKQGNPGVLTNVHWSHPLLAPLYDPALSDLPQANFRMYCALSGTPGKDDIVLARFDDDMPALVEHPFGQGRVLLVNTTANNDWSDLPLKKSFIPLIDRMLTYLGTGVQRHDFVTGETAVLPLPGGSEGEEVTVTTPSGGKLRPRPQTQRGQTVIRLDELAEAGVYRVERGGKLVYPFAVNAGREDSPLGSMDAKILEEWWAPASFEMLTPEAAAERFQAASSYRILWPALLFFGGLLLLAETIYVYQLCPRVNPVQTESVVPERGLLKPVGK